MPFHFFFQNFDLQQLQAVEFATCDGSDSSVASCILRDLWQPQVREENKKIVKTRQGKQGRKWKTCKKKIRMSTGRNSTQNQKFMLKKGQKLVGTKEESEHENLENSTCNGRKSKPGTQGNTIRGHHSLGAMFLGSWGDLMVETC